MAFSQTAFPVIPVKLDFEELLDSEQAAALLKIHPKTLQRMARAGQIQAAQIGRLWRFRASQIDAWLKRRTEAA